VVKAKVKAAALVGLVVEVVKLVVAEAEAVHQVQTLLRRHRN
jgi:hypothetical protein